VCPDFFCTGGSEEKSRGLTPPYPNYTPKAPQSDHIVHLRLNDSLVQTPSPRLDIDAPRLRSMSVLLWWIEEDASP